MSAPVIPDGPLPRCLWCERVERNGVQPSVCYHLAGTPTDRAGWFAEERARAEDRADPADEVDARRDRYEAAQ